MIEYKCLRSEAVARARDMVNNGGMYILGTGDYTPGPGHTDTPWTPGRGKWKGKWGSDCAGYAICYAWKAIRHRPGFNKGAWATVEDDINVNSTMEDAVHHKELALGVVLQDVDTPVPGDLICYPTFRANDKTFVGHVGLIEKVGPRYKPGRYQELTILQCHGPNGFTPGAVRTDGSLFNHHDSIWPTRKTQIIRMKERQ